MVFVKTLTINSTSQIKKWFAQSKLQVILFNLNVYNRPEAPLIIPSFAFIMKLWLKLKWRSFTGKRFFVLVIK